MCRCQNTDKKTHFVFLDLLDLKITYKLMTVLTSGVVFPKILNYNIVLCKIRKFPVSLVVINFALEIPNFKFQIV